MAERSSAVTERQLAQREIDRFWREGWTFEYETRKLHPTEEAMQDAAYREFVGENLYRELQEFSR